MKNLSTPCFRILLLATVCTLTASVGFAGAKEQRKAVAARVASEIARHNLHKIYVADFLERLNSLISDAAPYRQRLLLRVRLFDESQCREKWFRCAQSH